MCVAGRAGGAIKNPKNKIDASVIIFLVSSNLDIC